MAIDIPLSFTYSVLSTPLLGKVHSPSALLTEKQKQKKPHTHEQNLTQSLIQLRIYDTHVVDTF